jgi:hypothetical protein
MDCRKIDMENARHQVFHCASSRENLVYEPRGHVILNKVPIINNANCWLTTKITGLPDQSLP